MISGKHWSWEPEWQHRSTMQQSRSRRRQKKMMWNDRMNYWKRRLKRDRMRFWSLHPVLQNPTKYWMKQRKKELGSVLLIPIRKNRCRIWRLQRTIWKQERNSVNLRHHFSDRMIRLRSWPMWRVYPPQWREKRDFAKDSEIWQIILLRSYIVIRSMRNHVNWQMNLCKNIRILRWSQEWTNIHQ